MLIRRKSRLGPKLIIRNIIQLRLYKNVPKKNKREFIKSLQSQPMPSYLKQAFTLLPAKLHEIMKTIPENSSPTILFCCHHKDFPLNVSVKLFENLLSRQINISSVHFIITHIDSLSPLPRMKSFLSLKQEFHKSLTAYLRYFDIHLDIPISRIHLTSPHMKFTITELINNALPLHQPSSTYIIGQTNSGKSTIARLLKRELTPNMPTSNSYNISPSPFSSRVNLTFETPNTNIIDTPGFVDDNYGIWGSLKREFRLSLKNQEKIDREFKKIKILANGIGEETDYNVDKTGASVKRDRKNFKMVIGIGGLLYVKPWDVSELGLKYTDVLMDVEIKRSIYGKIFKYTMSELHNELYVDPYSVNIENWRRMVVGPDMGIVDIIIDNVGHIELKATRKTIWEIWVPERAKVISRRHIDSEIRYETVPSFEGDLRNVLRENLIGERKIEFSTLN